jgi:DNA repair protein RadC
MSEKEKLTKSASNTNAGHKQRLRERFFKSGFVGFQDYEILELLLSYAITRRDTKQIAKKLLDEFGSLSYVLDAKLPELQEVVSERTATYLKMIRETISNYHYDRSIERECFTTIDELLTYLRARLGGKQNEVVHVLYLNSKNVLISSEDLGEGTVTEAVAFPRRIVESALKFGSTSIIMAHNHPGGLCEPSESDNRITEQIKKALETVNISLQEHIILSNDGYYSYRKNGLLD